jgi:XTP/dITP diphosphohydrolase
LQTIVVASHNPGKLIEFRRILEPFGLSVLSMAEAGFKGDIAEEGESFSENAELKARAVHAAIGLPAIADDSGLCIDFLGGRPGVYSARYLGEETDYDQKRAGILTEMQNCPDPQRTARFVAALAFIDAHGCCHSFEEACEGVIGHRDAGSGGFGYDPIFYVEGRSFAELSADEKDKISHRGKALRAFVAALPRILQK